MEGTSAENSNKFIVPEEESEQKSENGQEMTLNVDPDFADEQSASEELGDDQCFEDGCAPPAPISAIREDAIERRSKDKAAGVKMSIGNYDDVGGDSEEDEQEQRRRFVEGIRNIRQNQQQESFDLEQNADEMRDFIFQQVDGMLCNAENELQRLDYEPMAKRKTPKVVEGYMWGAQIGTGSYGKVKEVIDTASLTRRAAKIMKYDRLRKITNGWENIRSEMSILRKLNHPNIIKLVEVFNIPTKGKVYMIFEYCIGSVQQLLDLEPARRTTIGEAHAIFLEMCNGLSYLHARRISHKDIKPGNLLVSIDFTIKICDFGVAEQISMFQNDGTCTKVNGTPKFQPPECVYGNHESFDGYKADMWSAGVTLYNMVSGKYPFERPILLKLYECIGTEPLVMPANVTLSNELQDLLTQLIEKDFEKRLDCQQTLIHPWTLSAFPEDQGLGRIMERMRTGNRPLTMRPSLITLFDGIDHEIVVDEDGKETIVYRPTVIGGEIDQHTFPGFKFLEATAADQMTSANEDNPPRRPSSRSMPTSAPTPASDLPSASSSSAPAGLPAEVVAEAAAEEPVRRRPRKRNLFSCIFRRRTDSV